MANKSQTPAPSRRFVHPSSSATQQTVSSKKLVPAFSQRPNASSGSGSVRNVRFGTPIVQREDISTSFDDDLHTTSTAPAVRWPRQSAGLSRDEIDGGRSKAEIEDEGSHETWGPVDFETPMPKRQKRVHSQTIPADPIAISSSESEQEYQGEASSDEDIAPPHPADTPVPTSKFRMPAPVVKTEELKSKPTFRSLEQATAVTNDMSTTLPDAFTPSRRKGKRDYVPGGLADTVRSWVLQAASEESRRGGKAEREVSVVDAVLDESRRGIACKDAHGLEWLLVGSQPWSASALSAGTVEQILEDGVVVARGTSTSWSVPLKALGQATDLQVAAHWELPR